MNYRKYKCFLVAAALSAGMCLTACGGGDVAAVTEKNSESVSVNNSEFVDNNSTAGTEENVEVTTETDKEPTTELKMSEGEASDKEDVNAEVTDSVTMYTTESITLHKEASASSEDLGVVAVGSTVQAYETSGDYIKISFDGKEGYVLKDYVTEDKDIADKALESVQKAAAKSDEKKSSGKDTGKKKSTECLENGLLN